MNAGTIAVQLGAALLPTLIEEIAAALRGGMSEEEATQAALSRMRAMELPAPVSGEIAEKYRKAREGLPDSTPPRPSLPPARAASLAEEHRAALASIAKDPQLAAHLTPAQRMALHRVTAIAIPSDPEQSA